MEKQNSERKLFVLLYHDVTNNPSEFLKENNLFVTPDIFEYQISIIKEYFNILGPDNIIKNNFSNRLSVLITFDDVFKGAFKNAAPILSKSELPAVFFLNYGDMESGVLWSGLVCYLMKYNRQFKSELKKNICNYKKKLSPLFLNVTPGFLENYSLIHQIDKKHVNDFIGEFATVEDLKNCTEKYKNIYYGNHLFRHYNAATLSNQELIKAYKINEEKIKKLPNYVPFFSFPFGQPNTCYTNDSIKTIESCGASYIFSAFPEINRVPLGRIIHRIHLDESRDTKRKILQRVFRKGFKTFVHKSFSAIRIRPFW